MMPAARTKESLPEEDAAAAAAAAGRRGSVLARTAKGAGWIVAWRMATRGLGLLNTLLLVRLLTPGDFGLVALAGSFVAAVDTFSMLGVEDSLVRERAPTWQMYNTAFTLNFARGCLTGLLILLSAAPVARFFGEPRLAMVMWALALGSLVDGMSNIGVVEFRRELEFDKEFRLQVVPRLLSVAVTVTCALTFRSYWALVAGILVGRFSRTAMSYWMHPHRPRPTLAAWRRLLGFSTWIWAISMIELVRDKVDSFAIGRVLGPTQVGVYAIGDEIASLPTVELLSPLCRACFSGFSKARHAGESMAATYVRTASLAVLVTLPAGLGISLVADPLIPVAAGPAWTAAIPVTQILGFAGVVMPFGLVAATMFSAHSMLKRQCAIMLACLCVRLAVMFPLIQRYHIAGAAIGLLIGMTCEQSVFLVAAFRRFRISYRLLAVRVWRVFAAGAVMAAVLVALGLGWHGVAASAGWAGLRLAGTSLLGAGVYTGTLVLLWLASGRPIGPETDVLDVALHLLRRIRPRLRSA